MATTRATATVSAVTLAAGLAGGYALRGTEAAPVVPPFAMCLRGDSNWDGVVDFDDINTTMANFGMTLEQSVWSGAKVYTNGDSNGGAGWQVNGPDNRVLIDAIGNVEDVEAALGIARGGVKFLSHTPDPSVPVGGEP